MFKRRQDRGAAETITVGDCLKRRREEAGLTLRELGAELGIREDYLRFLEDGNYKELPPQVYVRGFIRSYSRLMGVDGGQLTKIYNREMAFLGESEGYRPKRKPRQHKLSDYLVVTPKVLTLAASVLVLGVLGYYFFHQISSFNSKPYLFVESPSADEVVKEKDLWVKGRTEEDAILRINGQEIGVDSGGNFIQKVSLSEGRNTLMIEALNRFNRADRRSINIVYDKPYEAPAPEVIEAPAPAGTSKTEEVPDIRPSATAGGAVRGASTASTKKPAAVAVPPAPTVSELPAAEDTGTKAPGSATQTEAPPMVEKINE